MQKFVRLFVSFAAFGALSSSLAGCAGPTPTEASAGCAVPLATVEVDDYMASMGVQFKANPLINWGADTDSNDLPQRLRQTGCFRVVEKNPVLDQVRKYNHHAVIPDYLATATTHIEQGSIGKQLLTSPQMMGGLFMDPFNRSVDITLTRVRDEQTQTFVGRNMTDAINHLVAAFAVRQARE